MKRDLVREFNRIVKDFFDKTDSLIKAHKKTMTCNDLYKMNNTMIVELKSRKGISTGFIGLSEYLVFRLMCEILGGRFKCEEIPGKDTCKFVSLKKKDLSITQGVTHPIGKMNIKPDIVVSDGDEIISVCEVKKYLTEGREKTIKKIIKKLRQINKNCPNCCSTFLLYNQVSDQVLRDLEQIKKDHSWFNYIILQGNNELAARHFKEKMGLSAYA